MNGSQILMNELKEWYKWYRNLYKGERILVLIGLAVLFVLLALWVTHEPRERQGVPKPIILQGRF
jgi:hypothetical protein